MDKKKIATLVGVIMVAAGTILGMFGFADITAFAVTVLGAGVAAFNLWKNRKEGTPKWVGITSMVLLGAGSVIVGFLGLFDAEGYAGFIGYIVAAVVFIAGLFGYKFLPKMFSKKEVEKK